VNNTIILLSFVVRRRPESGMMQDNNMLVFTAAVEAKRGEDGKKREMELN